MRTLKKLGLVTALAKWRLTWNRIDTSVNFTVPGNPKFMGPKDAVKKFLGKSGLVVATSGLAANGSAGLIYRAIAELYREKEIPGGLTFMASGGIGGRGRVPGTLDEVGIEGLCTRFITGHIETFKAIQRLADAGKLELQCLPQGILNLLWGELAEDRNWFDTETGLGTFLDISAGGRGTPVVGDWPQFVEKVGSKLRYMAPKIDVAVFNAPAADEEGNIYADGAAILAESEMITKAAKQNHGFVIVNVGKIVPHDPGKIFIHAKDVDAVVFGPKTKQTLCFPYAKGGLECLTTTSTVTAKEGMEQVKFINRKLGITPKRTPVDFALARLAALIFVHNTKPGCYLDIGVGLPEVAGEILGETGITGLINIMVESGVMGGRPAPGVFFGAAVNPTHMVSSTEAFRLIYEKLDAVILGALQVGWNGDINVSKRGKGAINYVGPGGAIDLMEKAQLIIICTSWAAESKIQIVNGKVVVDEFKKPKFVRQVDEVTYSAQRALDLGKKVFYVTPLGAFQLVPEGLRLCAIMPDAAKNYRIIKDTIPGISTDLRVLGY